MNLTEKLNELEAENGPTEMTTTFRKLIGLHAPVYGYGEYCSECECDCLGNPSGWPCETIATMCNTLECEPDQPPLTPAQRAHKAHREAERERRRLEAQRVSENRAERRAANYRNQQQ